jgi:hypothetical protein
MRDHTQEPYHNYIKRKNTEYEKIYNRISDVTDRYTFNEASVQTDVNVMGNLKVQGRDVMKELDELRASMLLLNRDIDMEEKYPDLKEAYDNYNKVLEELLVVEKLTNEHS